jgi:hypothetical protein
MRHRMVPSREERQDGFIVSGMTGLLAGDEVADCTTKPLLNKDEGQDSICCSKGGRTRLK